MLPDIQASYDKREIELDQVGVAGVRYPITFRDGTLRQSGIASIDLTVTLQADRRGTHMSRMIELIHGHLAELDPRELPTILKTAAIRLDADRLKLTASLPVATLVSSPASGKQSWQTSDVTLTASLAETVSEVTTRVTTDVTSLCPCSKAISDYGAHNQRSAVTLAVVGLGDTPYPLSVASAINMIRGIGSSPVYPVVKRPDERVITMEAYDHPAFAEDIARDLSQQCRAQGLPHQVKVRNIESIHSHDAVAVVTWMG